MCVEDRENTGGGGDEVTAAFELLHLPATPEARP
jgi:hypothetical protein